MAYEYKDYIAEVEALYAEPARWTPNDRHAISGTFSRWSRELEHSMNKIANAGYRGDERRFLQRRFGIGQSVLSELISFASDLEATLHDLEMSIRDFKRYGPPPLHGTVLPAGQLALAPTVAVKDGSIAYLVKIVPAPVFITAAGMGVALFSAGLYAGGTPAGKTILMYFQTPVAPSSGPGSSTAGPQGVQPSGAAVSLPTGSASATPVKP